MIHSNPFVFTVQLRSNYKRGSKYHFFVGFWTGTWGRSAIFFFLAAVQKFGGIFDKPVITNVFTSEGN